MEYLVPRLARVTTYDARDRRVQCEGRSTGSGWPFKRENKFVRGSPCVCYESLAESGNQVSARHTAERSAAD
jgi:hypothetical protein